MGSTEDMATSKRVTMRDIAAAAGVPVSAVALALGDKPGVSSILRGAVLGYLGESEWHFRQLEALALQFRNEGVGANGI